MNHWTIAIKSDSLSPILGTHMLERDYSPKLSFNVLVASEKTSWSIK